MGSTQQVDFFEVLGASHKKWGRVYMVSKVKELESAIYLVFEGETLVEMTYNNRKAAQAETDGKIVILTPIQSQSVFSELIPKKLTKTVWEKREDKMIKEQQLLSSHIEKLEKEVTNLTELLQSKNKLENALKSVISDYRKGMTALEKSFKDTLKNNKKFDDEKDIRKHYFDLRELMQEKTQSIQKVLKNTEIKLDVFYAFSAREKGNN